ncbi:MAG: hypothetical protein HDS14_05965 [Bacteroides sp.]|nr:hypothetical protein [Bacteroides sp.]
MATSSCSNTILKSLEWCQGQTSLPGLRRRAAICLKSDIAAYPVLTNRSGNGLQGILKGEFKLLADRQWKIIDFLPDKSTATVETQGEAPSQTFLCKLSLLHPSVSRAASEVAAMLLNNDCVIVFQDMNGILRVAGNNIWPTKVTVAQDYGQGPTGAVSTTFNIEVTDQIPFPIYSQTLETEFGPIAPEGASQYETADSDPGFPDPSPSSQDYTLK